MDLKKQERDGLKLFADLCMTMVGHDQVLKVVCSMGQKFINGMLLGIYVDDCVIAGPRKQQLVNDFLKTLKDTFKIRVMRMSYFTYFIGFNIHYQPSERKMHINQSTYVQKVLDKFGQHISYGASTPAIAGLKLDSIADEADIVRPDEYRSVVASLIYLSTSFRPDLSYCFIPFKIFGKTRTKTLGCSGTCTPKIGRAHV